MLKFLKHIEMKTLNGRVKKADSENRNGLGSAHEREKSSSIGFIVVENESSKEADVHVCAADVANYGKLPITGRPSAAESYHKHRRGRGLYRWRIDELQVDENGKASRRRNAWQFSDLCRK